MHPGFPTGLSRKHLLSIAAALLLASGLAHANVFEDYRQPQIRGEGFSVPRTAADGSTAPLTAEIGHLRLLFRSGSFHPLLSSEGRHVGWYFDGDGRYFYESEEPADRMILEDNVRRVAGKLEVHEWTVADDFEELLVLRAGLEVLDPLAGQPLPAELPPASPDRQARFEALWRSIQLGDLEFDHYAAAIESNGSSDKYAYVEVVGRFARIGYEYDQHRSWMESLFTFRKFAGYEWRFREDLSSQVLPGRNEARTDLLLTHADLKVVTPDNRTGTIGGRLTLRAAREGLRVGVLYLSNNRDPDTPRWQSEKKALKVTKLVDGQGRPFDFSHRYHELAIDFGRALAQGEEITLEFDSEAAIFTDASGEYSDRYRDLFFVNWYPRARTLEGNQFTFELELRCKPPFFAVASGDTVFSGIEDGLHVTRTASTVPVASIAVFLGVYKTAEQKVGDLTVKVHGYGLVREKELEQIANVTAMFVHFYSGILGALPYEELEVVELPTFGFFAISPPGVVIMTSRSFEPTNAYMREFLGNRGVNAMIAHEVAHQWFAHKAWPSDVLLDNWLTESFAEYMSGLAVEWATKQHEAQGKNTKNVMKGFKNLHDEWWRFTKEVAGIGTIRGANRLSGDLSLHYRVDLLYNRGPLVLHQLRTLIGDQKFLEILNAWLSEANHGPTDTGDLVAVASKVLRQDMRWYFDQWLNQSGIPQIEVQHQLTSAGGKTILSGEVRQTGDEFFKIHVPLVVKMPGGKLAVYLVFQEQPVQPFRFELPATPEKVMVDPGGNNLAEYR